MPEEHNINLNFSIGRRGFFSVAKYVHEYIGFEISSFKNACNFDIVTEQPGNNKI